jgi:beta-alanine degradation protein BauB
MGSEFTLHPRQFCTGARPANLPFFRFRIYIERRRAAGTAARPQLNNKRGSPVKKQHVIAIVGTSALLVCAAAVVAQDQVKVQPESNKVLLENDRVRVIEVKNAPGGTMKMHSHPGHVVYFLETAKTKQTDKAGKVVEVEGKKGTARWVDAVTHTVENTGKTPVHAIVIEVKDAK